MVIAKDRPRAPPVFSAPIRDQVMIDPVMKKGGISQKQKVKQSQVVNVKVNVNPAEKKAKARRRAPRAKKAVAGDSIALQHGNVPSHSIDFSSFGTPKRLAGPGQSYASLPLPLQSARYAAAPNTMNPQASPAFIASSDYLYNRNRHVNDDVHVMVNPADITPVAAPSKRMVKSETAPGSGYMPSASPSAEAASMSLTRFQGDIPRLNEPDLTPSTLGVKAQPTAGFMLRNNPGMYPDSWADDEREEESGGSEEEQPQAAASAAASATSVSPPRRRGPPIARPKNVNVGGEASSGKQAASTPGVDLMANPYVIQNDDLLLKMASHLGIKNAKQKFAGVGFRARLRGAIAEVQQGMSGSSSSGMRRGGSVF